MVSRQKICRVSKKIENYADSAKICRVSKKFENYADSAKIMVSRQK